MKKNSIKSMIPNITTLIGLCFGITAIRFALSSQFELSVICIVMASVCDVLDGINMGIVARKRHRIEFGLVPLA